MEEDIRRLKQQNSIENAGYYRTVYKYTSIPRLNDIDKMHGPRRVVTFCLLTAVLPTLLIIIPLYLRHSVFADVSYQVAESDIFEIHEGMSSIFCQEHILQMNSSFNAYQLSSLPEISNNRKHIRLKKSMMLPDDTLEYWGFYLLKGSTVALKVCSRHDGSRILVVRGERNLRTCGLLQHNRPHLDKDYKQVKVTFETAAQEINDSRENIKVFNSEKPVEEQNNDQDTAAEDEADDDLKVLQEDAERFINKRRNKTKDFVSKHSKRHTKRHHERVRELQDELLDNNKRRRKRETGHKLDGAIGHGGNALNYTSVPSGESNSVSSFETNLLDCYDGQILLTQGFPPSNLCNDLQYLARGEHMQMVHEVSSDGYYYYIFYSDNDIVSNDIYAVFDIYKPTYQYSNLSDTKQCINSTECNFSVAFFSDETVIVEVPTRDGIEHEEDDITLLVSKCKPRMAIYIIFPISILFLILGCAFL